jgi:hypothetical protein
MQHTFRSHLSLRCARYVIAQYPLCWRERYAEEMLLLLEDHPPTFSTIINLVVHLFDAYMHPHLPGGVLPDMWRRMRTSELSIYSSALVFWFAAVFVLSNLYLALIPLTSTDRFSSLIPLYNLAHYSPLLLIPFILLNGLPIFIATGWRALTTRTYHALLFLLLSLLCPAIIAFVSAHWSIEIGDAWWNAFLLLLVPITNALFLHMAVQSVQPSRRVTYTSLYLAAPLSLIMLAICIALFCYALPALMTGNAIPFITSLPWPYIWISFSTLCLVVVPMFLIMLAACIFSLVSLLKGFQARNVVQNSF